MIRRLLAAALAGLALPASAQPVSLQDSFRIGTGASLLCTTQSLVTDRALEDMFDRGYAIVCRDAAVPIGHVYALRSRAGDPVQRLATIRSERTACQPSEPQQVENLGTVQTLSCRLNAADVTYRVYLTQRGDTLYVAEGLGGYDSALRLALRSVVADRVAEGEVSVATTGAGDPAAFARAQAGTLDPQRALAEAYRRNNAGSYAEAAEFFSAITSRQGAEQSRAEALVNEALQKSNLGRYGEAEALFASAAELAGADPVTARRLRNYRAMHLLNQGLAEESLAELNRPVPPIGIAGAVEQLVIDGPTAARLSAESPGARRLGGNEGLTGEDKAQILDGQALQLRGTLLRLQGRPAEAVVPLTQALGELFAIRGGRVAATVWMRAQIHGELADIAEAQGDLATAEREHLASVALLETNYPSSAALMSAKGRHAGYLARHGRVEEATLLFRDVVKANADSGSSSPTLRRVLAPYFALLARRGDDPAAVAEMFAASQVLVRPGVAQTQAVLARELSGGSDDAARLFRQAVTLTRDIERARVDLARLEGLEAATAADSARIETLRAEIDQMQQDQVATQARLADFPQYRAVAGGVLELAQLQALLGPGEAYYKLTALDDEAYAILATAQGARAFRIDIAPAELERQVDALRSTISAVENGQQVTYAFDVELAHRLYRSLFGPAAAEIAAARHLIFEPDGAMLRLPPNLLIMDQAGVETDPHPPPAPGNDGFDFTGVEWLGRGRDISTAVSARAFRDVRQAPPSQARAEYIGFGQNAPNGGFFQAAGTRGGVAEACDWSLATWNRPISAAELFTASRAIAGGDPAEAEIVTGAAFTDTAIKERPDLDEFRVLHFATHGLVTPPRPECPARPALLTSFGGGGSDGLLSFAEIFDLRLDADLIILSACDTAGQAGLAASQEAGLTSGGDFALDGLVRAFVGAGGRMVVASHWPVPDDFDATTRLIAGLFDAPPGTGTAAALRNAQRALMDDPATSHPYYWSGFAVVGDGMTPVIRAEPVRTASR
jgi:CHAT domain-containing protein